MKYPCWNDMIRCEHLKNISDADEEPEYVCELSNEECPFVEENDDDDNVFQNRENNYR